MPEKTIRIKGYRFIVSTFIPPGGNAAHTRWTWRAGDAELFGYVPDSPPPCISEEEMRRVIANWLRNLKPKRKG